MQLNFSQPAYMLSSIDADKTLFLADRATAPRFIHMFDPRLIGFCPQRPYESEQGRETASNYSFVEGR